MTKEYDLIGDIHATSITCCRPLNRNRMLATLRKLIEEELVIQYDHQVDERWAQHTEDVLPHTLGREIYYVRGGNVENGAAAEDGITRDKLAAEGPAVPQWRHPRPSSSSRRSWQLPQPCRSCGKWHSFHCIRGFDLGIARRRTLSESLAHYAEAC